MEKSRERRSFPACVDVSPERRMPCQATRSPGEPLRRLAGVDLIASHVPYTRPRLAHPLDSSDRIGAIGTLNLVTEPVKPGLGEVSAPQELMQGIRPCNHG